MVCRRCNKVISDNVLFCEHCGNPVNGNGYNNPQKSNTIIYVLILMITLIIAMAAVAICFAVNYFGHNDSSISKEIREDYSLTTEDTHLDGEGDNRAFNVGGIYYKIYDKTLVISGNGELDKKTINSFSQKAFDSVLFESGNIDIPDDTFSGFSNIKKVELKNVVNRIGARAFKGCGFYLIAIGTSISEIGEDAFADCAISDVYLNNPQIRANLNSRYDFGGLFENASTIAIFSGTTEYECSDFTVEESQWGQYLRDNEEYDRLKTIASPTKQSAKRAYDIWANAIRPGFYHFNYIGLESQTTTYGGGEYDAETNTLILDD